MGLKGAGPYFQRSMQNKVLNGLVYEICEIYIDDVLIHGKTDEDFLANTRRVFESLSTPEKQSWVSRRSNTSVTSSLRQVPHSLEGPELSSAFNSKGDAPIPRPRELLPRSCPKHDRDGKTPCET